MVALQPVGALLILSSGVVGRGGQRNWQVIHKVLGVWFPPRGPEDAAQRVHCHHQVIPLLPPSGRAGPFTATEWLGLLLGGGVPIMVSRKGRGCWSRAVLC